MPYRQWVLTMAAGQMATIIELLGEPRGCPIRYTCAEATTIPKGTILKLTTPRLVAASSADNDKFAGIAAMEKVGGDGSTEITAYTRGIFGLSCKAAITAGERVSIKDAQKIAKVAAADILFSDVGVALDDGAGDDSVITVLVGGMGY